MEKKLSVIVPAYNIEKFLPQCIDSILNQSMKEIELILVDDGSTDSSGAICDKYAGLDSRVKVFHQENQGPVEARRKGVMESTCEYVTFVDGDDFIAPVSYALAQESMNQGIDLIIFGLTRYYSEQYSFVKYNTFPEGVYTKPEIRKDIFPQMIWTESADWGIDPSLCNKVAKRSLLVSAYRIYSNSDIFMGEDASITYPMIGFADTLEIKNRSYYYHRQRGIAFVPSYIKDEAYFDKLYKFYCHMRSVFRGEESIIRQIEYSYINMASYRKWVYEGRKLQTFRLFPFDKVEKGARVALYGAGTVGQAYNEQLKRVDFCEVVLWVDKNYEEYSQLRVRPVEELLTVSYDKLVIAVADQTVRAAIADDLSSMGIVKTKIIL